MADATGSWCTCSEAFRLVDDDEPFCWRCGKPIEAKDPETDEGLGHAEDEDDE
jgi:hypothetical protein